MNIRFMIALSLLSSVAHAEGLDPKLYPFTCNTDNSSDSIMIRPVTDVKKSTTTGPWRGFEINTTTHTRSLLVGTALVVKGRWHGNTIPKDVDVYGGDHRDGQDPSTSMDLCKKVAERSKTMTTPHEFAINTTCKAVRNAEPNGPQVVIPYIKSCTIDGVIPADLLAETQAAYQAAQPSPTAAPNHGGYNPNSGIKKRR